MRGFAYAADRQIPSFVGRHRGGRDEYRPPSWGTSQDAILVASAAGSVAVLAIAVAQRGMSRLALWAAVICAAIATVVDIVVVPLASWRLLVNRSLRTKVNAYSIMFGGIFLLLIVLQFAI